jgi:hypothetical protein
LKRQAIPRGESDTKDFQGQAQTFAERIPEIALNAGRLNIEVNSEQTNARNEKNSRRGPRSYPDEMFHWFGLSGAGNARECLGDGWEVLPTLPNLSPRPARCERLRRTSAPPPNNPGQINCESSARFLGARWIAFGRRPCPTKPAFKELSPTGWPSRKQRPSVPRIARPRQTKALTAFSAFKYARFRQTAHPICLLNATRILLL